MEIGDDSTTRTRKSKKSKKEKKTKRSKKEKKSKKSKKEKKKKKLKQVEQLEIDDDVSLEYIRNLRLRKRVNPIGYSEEEEHDKVVVKKLKLSRDSITPILTDQESQTPPITPQFVNSYNWNEYRRPPLPKLDLKKDSIAFQKLQIDYVLGDRCSLSRTSLLGKIPIIRLYGVTRDGNSVQCNVHNFYPYFLIETPVGFRDSHLYNLMKSLDTAIRLKLKKEDLQDQRDPLIISTELVQGNSIMGYTWGRQRQFIKIVLQSPKLVPTCRELLEGGIEVTGFKRMTCMTYESNIAFVLRFMIDIGLVGAGWLEIKGGNYQVVQSNAHGSTSVCQLELNVSWDNIVAHEADGEWSIMAPIRILSFDIECAGRKGTFPQPEIDPVIQISNYMHVQGSPENKYLVKNVFNVNTASPLEEGEILCFRTESEMLSEWQRFIRQTDPDIIIGYNITNFDFPYLINRASTLKLESFLYLGRLLEGKTWMKNSTFSSRAYGTRESKECHLSGRVIFDILQVIQRDYKLRSYTLNSVSAHFLEEQKDNIKHTMITDLFNGSDSDRKRLATYCLKDSYLPLKLLNKLMILYNYCEMARVTGVPLDYLLSKGQQIKVISQLYRKGKEYNRFIPYYTHQVRDLRSGEEDESYEGASVLDPKKGYHDKPIPTLDFKSLYPSIMIAYNMCYSTLLKTEELQKLRNDQYIQTPHGDHFLSKDVAQGILPMILEDLLTARNRAKEELKKEKDPIKRAVLDGRQLALKISANSVYGFTGATVGKLPCLAISASVTACGRDMIELSKKSVEQHYCKQNGYEHDAEVIYGDTDSVMVKFGIDSVEEAMRLGREAAKLITDKINKPPIELAFEKVYYPYLLISKKRYAGLYWTKSNKYDRMDAKGIETVRRDSCLLTVKMIQTCLDKILISRDVESAQQYVKDTISDLLLDKIDLSLLVITKSLSKDSKEYINKQPHTELVEKMKMRDPHTAPTIGDRVKYVMIKSLKNSKAFEKSEDPLRVLEFDLPIDHDYYLEKQIKKPILRIFKSIMTNPESLFLGDHTKRRVILTPKAGGLIDFAIKLPHCLACKGQLRETERAVCDQCKDEESRIYTESVHHMNELEEKFAAFWTQCQICQGSLSQPVICGNDECPIFYARQKVKRDLSKAIETVERFDLSW